MVRVFFLLLSSFYLFFASTQNLWFCVNYTEINLIIFYTIYHRSIDTHPGEAEAVDTVGEHVPEEGGVGVLGGEVGVHVRALPMGHLHRE